MLGCSGWGSATGGSDEGLAVAGWGLATLGDEWPRLSSLRFDTHFYL